VTRSFLLVLALVTVGSTPPLGAEASGQTRTRIVMLGTGTPNADPERSGPAVAIVVDDRSYVVDCGPGVVRRAAAAAEMHDIPALRPSQLRRLFVTHLHSDHTLGCPDLLLSPWVLDRTTPLSVWGPAGTASMFEHILAAYREDVAMRIYGLEPRPAQGYQADVTEISPGVVYEDDLVRVTAIPVSHGSWPEAYGYRFDTPDRSIVLSGDAAYSESLIEACDGCDVLIHEVISESGLSRRTPEWQAYHRSYHTTSIELGELATRARPGTLILYHQLFSGATEDVLLQEVRQGFAGLVISARDLEVH
jgi:ribonuclease BN (tRNA processing enzyme)